jgi:hypothetical protein
MKSVEKHEHRRAQGTNRGAQRFFYQSAGYPVQTTFYFLFLLEKPQCASVSPLCAPVIMLFTNRQSAPSFQSTNVINMAEMPFTNVTPPKEIRADLRGMRVSEVQTQK